MVSRVGRGRRLHRGGASGPVSVPSRWLPVVAALLSCRAPVAQVPDAPRGVWSYELGASADGRELRRSRRHSRRTRRPCRSTTGPPRSYATSRSAKAPRGVSREREWSAARAASFAIASCSPMRRAPQATRTSRRRSAAPSYLPARPGRSIRRRGWPSPSGSTGSAKGASCRGRPPHGTTTRRSNPPTSDSTTRRIRPSARGAREARSLPGRRSRSASRPAERATDDDTLVAWVRAGAEALAAYFGHLAASRPLVLVVPGRGRRHRRRDARGRRRLRAPPRGNGRHAGEGPRELGRDARAGARQPPVVRLSAQVARGGARDVRGAGRAHPGGDAPRRRDVERPTREPPERSPGGWRRGPRESHTAGEELITGARSSA